MRFCASFGNLRNHRHPTTFTCHTVNLFPLILVDKNENHRCTIYDGLLLVLVVLNSYFRKIWNGVYIRIMFMVLTGNMQMKQVHENSMRCTSVEDAEMRSHADVQVVMLSSKEICK